MLYKSFVIGPTCYPYFLHIHHNIFNCIYNSVRPNKKSTLAQRYNRFSMMASSDFHLKLSFYCSCRASCKVQDASRRWLLKDSTLWLMWQHYQSDAVALSIFFDVAHACFPTVGKVDMCSRGIAFTNLLKLMRCCVSYGLWQHGTCSLRRNGWVKSESRIWFN